MIKGKMHGPFPTKRARDDALALLQAKKTCPCENCDQLADDKKPRAAPHNMMRLRGRGGAYWIGSMTSGVVPDAPV